MIDEPQLQKCEQLRLHMHVYYQSRKKPAPNVLISENGAGTLLRQDRKGTER
jgi:hypothetical protein